MTDTERATRILLIEDSPEDAELMTSVLRRDGLDVAPLVVAGEAGLRAALPAFSPDVILADLAMPGLSGAAALAIAREWDPAVPCILVSGTLGEDLVILAVRTGATDYVPKQHLDMLAPAVRRALAEGAERRARARLEGELAKSQAGMRQSLDLMRDPFIVTAAVRDADGTLTGFRSIFANRAAASFMGREPDTLTGAPLPERMPFIGKEPFFEVFRRVVDTGESWTEDATEFSVPGPDGTRRRGLVNIQVARSGDGFFATWQDVTDKERLHRERERLVAALEQTADGVAVVEPDGTMVYANPAFLASRGLTRGDVIGRDVRPFGASILGEDALKELLATMTAGMSWRHDIDHRLPDGTLRNLEITVSPTFDSAGVAAGYVALSRDVTAQHEADAALERRRVLRMAVSNVDRNILHLPDVAAVAAEACRAIVETGEVAMAWVGILGPANDQFVVAGSHGDAGYLAEVGIRADDSVLGRGPAGEAVRTGIPVVIDDIATDPSMIPWLEPTERHGYRSVAVFPVRHGDATRGVLVAYGARPCAFDSDAMEVLGQLAADVALAFSLIEEAESRRQFQTALAASEDLFRESQRAAFIGSYRAEFGSDRWTSSDVLDQIFGIDSAYPRTIDSWAQLIHPDDRAMMLAYPRDEVIGRRQPFRQQYRIVRPSDGEIRWVSGHGKLSIDANGDVAAMTGTIQDVTERKAAEDEVRRLNGELEDRVRERTASLEAANRELETFSYTVSHDLRSPLRAITGFAEILDRRYRDHLDQRGRHYLDNIVEGGRHMGLLIEELLEYARLGRTSVRAEPVPLGPILDRLRATLADRVRASGGTLAVGEPLAVPAGDPVLLGQVLANLLDNAFAYRRPGVAPLVVVSAVRRGGRVVLEVADNGLGIAPEFQARVFEPFVRLHTADEYPGTGIGLATVRKAARLMGCEVGLTSVEGQGSSFSLDLPAAPATTATPADRTGGRR